MNQKREGGLNTTTHILCGLAHEHEALSIRDNLGSIKGLFEVVDELLLVAVEWLFLRTRDDLACANAFLFKRGQTPSEYGLSDQGDYRRGK